MTTADEIFFVEGPEEEAVPICSVHKEALEGGEFWILQHLTQPSGPVVANVLMSGDVPWRVLAASAESASGSATGLLLHLTISHSGELKDLQLLVPWDEAEVLKGLLDS
ncbi:hypothetical protein J7I86_11695 [Arthrobacter sp. ISL-95]|nr:hypothetical protein [Arthrobacter sp. ISL-95]